jgi:hypothetical protein
LFERAHGSHPKRAPVSRGLPRRNSGAVTRFLPSSWS